MKTVISASRRTDLPAYYLDRLLHFIRQGFAEVANPYSGKSYLVDLHPENVHTLVFWSKNFGPFLEKSGLFSDYNCYFLFTVNDMPALEPGTITLAARLDQAAELTARYGSRRIGWRFDPIVFRHEGPVMDIDTFKRIADGMAKAGISRVIFSFLDMYGKVKKRNEQLQLHLYDPPRDVKFNYATKLAEAAVEYGMTLESCCEDFDGIENISRAACIDGHLLAELAGEPAETMKDAGQREKCACTLSRDIGSYRDMPCPNGCLYCYANPHITLNKE